VGRGTSDQSVETMWENDVMLGTVSELQGYVTRVTG
jgi:hypothetical protein